MFRTIVAGVLLLAAAAGAAEAQGTRRAPTEGTPYANPAMVAKQKGTAPPMTAGTPALSPSEAKRAQRGRQPAGQVGGR